MASDFGSLDEQAGNELAERSQYGSGKQPKRATLEVIRRAFESAGVELIDENGGKPGVRLRKRPAQGSPSPAPARARSD